MLRFVEECLVAVWECAPDLFAQGLTSPVVGRGDLAVVGGEAEEEALAPIPLTRELADVELARRAHRCCSGITDVGVVLPDDHLRPAELPVEMVDERVEGERHVAVPEVPGAHRRPVHLLVVLLGVAHDESVLLGEELLVLGEPPVSTEIELGASAQLDELGHHLVLAREGATECEGVPVRLAVCSHLVEARVAPAGPGCFVGIDPVEVADHRLHRRAEAVQIETVEASLGGRIAMGVPLPQPLDEVHDIPVAPHPRRKPLEVAECGRRVGVAREAHHVAVDPVRVGPVALDRDGSEAELVDQPPRDARPLPVELVGPVRRLPDEHDPPDPARSTRSS